MNIAANAVPCKGVTYIGFKMRKLHNIERPALLDLLATSTLKLTHLVRNYTKTGSTKEIKDCKKKLQDIIIEIEKRDSPSPSVPIAGRGQGKNPVGNNRI